MNNLFARHLDLNVIVYMDDVLIYIKTEVEHKEHLAAVFQLLKEYKFYVKQNKYSFFQERVTFFRT